MLSPLKSTFFAMLACLCASLPVSAHHGTSINYDVGETITVDAVVTKFRFAQPHLQIFFDIKGKDGKVVKWACEYVPNIPYLIREGWSKKRMEAALQVGTELKVTMSPARSGKPVGLVVKMVNKKGEVIGPNFDPNDPSVSK